MFYIVTALAGEAIPIINAFKLKKDISYSKFDLFKNENMKLILSGSGKIKSAIATMYMIVKDPPRPEDHILNIGICGTGQEEHKIGQMFLVNKIEDFSNGKTYYPEQVFKHSLPEEKLITYDTPVRRKDIADIPLCLVDMEAAGFYEAASTHFHSHRIHILKIVSDHLKTEKLTGTFVQSLLEKNVPTLKTIFKQTTQTPVPDANVLNDKDYMLFDSLSNDLKLSTTQRFQILDLIKSYKIRSGGDLDFLKNYIKQKKAAKSDNKKIFQAIVEKLEDGFEDS
jgi:nucleoside phosphorylase